MATKARAANIITPEFRGSFVHLHSFENDPATGQPSTKHSIIMLFPKRSADWRTDLPWLVANCSEALQIQYPKFQGMPAVFNDPMSTAWPVSDGDLPNRKGNIQPAHQGHWVVRTASTLFDPAVNLLDGRSNSLGTMTPAQCFSGCYFEAQINAYFYDKGGNTGIAMGLNNIKFVREGESLGGGGQDAAGAWGVVPAVSSAAGAFAPVAAAPVAVPVAPVAGAPATAPAWLS